MEMFLRSCTSFTLQGGVEERGIYMIFLLFAFLGTCVCVCFGSDSFCLFPSREGLIIPIQSTHLMGQDPGVLCDW